MDLQFETGSRMQKVYSLHLIILLITPTGVQNVLYFDISSFIVTDWGVMCFIPILLDLFINNALTPGHSFSKN